MKKQELTDDEVKFLSEFLLEKTGYKLKNTFILQAFRRKSFASDYVPEHNENLELIGDTALSQFVLKAIVDKFATVSNGFFAIRTNEGRISYLKSQIVNNESLATIIDEWDVFKYVMVGKCDIDNNIDKEIKPKADLFEAILGAIVIQSAWNSTVLETAVKKMLSLEDKLNQITLNVYNPYDVKMENAVSKLDQYAKNGFFTVSKPEISGPDTLGYDENGNARWCCRYSAITQKTGVTRLVFSSSKKGAKNAAAYLVLCECLEFTNIYGVNDIYVVWDYVDGKLIPQHKRK